MKLFAIMLLLLCSCSSIQANSQKFARLTQYLEYVSSHKKAMGEVSIVTSGQEVYSKAYGFKNQDEDSIFRIGSISKTFTAVLIMKLVEEGKLSLQTKLSEFFPKLPNAELITIEHLLRHRSGLVNFTNVPGYSKIFLKKQSREKMLSFFIKNGADFHPDEKYSYSNTGYSVLSYIAEEIYEMSYADMLENVIAKPLRLENTFLYDKSRPRSKEVVSYKKFGDWVEASNTHQSVSLGAGGVASTVKELGFFIWSLFNGAILKPATVEKMKEIVDGYGLGIFSIPFADKKGFGHNGSIDGFRAEAYYMKDSDSVVVHLVNASNMKLNDTLMALLSSLYEQDFTFPEFEKEIKIPVEQLKKLVGNYKSKQIPLGLRVFIDKSWLFAQATGQGAFPLTAKSEDTFVFKQADVKIVFELGKNRFTLFQGGKDYLFIKQD